MKHPREATVSLNRDTQAILERLTLGDIYQALMQDPGRTEGVSGEALKALFRRAESRRFEAEALGRTALPAHLYLMDVLLEDQHPHPRLIDAIIAAVRRAVAEAHRDAPSSSGAF